MERGPPLTGGGRTRPLLVPELRLEDTIDDDADEEVRVPARRVTIEEEVAFPEGFEDGGGLLGEISDFLGGDGSRGDSVEAAMRRWRTSGSQDTSDTPTYVRKEEEELSLIHI